MKLYIKLLSLTLALMYVFLTGYVSGIFVDVSGAAQAILTEKLKFYPSPAAFEAIWSTVYLLETVLLTATISEKKLRRAGRKKAARPRAFSSVSNRSSPLA